MAAANESQGLKIAVAVFVTLTVILAVTTYFGFDSYSKADAKRAEAESKSSQLTTAQNTLQSQLTDLKTVAGYAKTEDAEVAKKVTADLDGLTKQINDLNQKIKQMVAEYKSANGANVKVDEIAQQTDQIVNAYQSEPNKTMQSALDRMLQLMGNQAQLAVTMALDNAEMRKVLETMNGVNKDQLDVEVKAKEGAKTDLEAEIAKHEGERNKLIARLDSLQTENSRLAAELTTTKNALAQGREEWKKLQGDLLGQVKSFREKAELSETVMDVPDGHVTYTDYVRMEVRCDITRAMGAREQMTFAVFDKKSPGLPTDKPKATIQLIRVDEDGSIARILKINENIDPIRPGDQIYSPAWSPNQPMRFALLGRIDVNRDGRDDRADLKRMIEAAGGIVDYDLPPPMVGKASGKLTPLTDWYVLDTRKELRPRTEKQIRLQEVGSDEASYNKQMTEIIRQARSEGVRPISIGRLLSELGYRYDITNTGRVEAANRKAIDVLLHPKGRTGVLPSNTNPPADDTAPPVDDNAPAPEPDDAQPMPEPEPDDNGGEMPK